jgi:short subunit dehydrogenase-like uncharacterized protein
MAAAESSRKYDVVVLGATGFTGTLVVEFLSRYYTNRLKWAIAGRCKEKLQSLKADLALSESIDELVVDADDQASIDYLASQTAVLLSAAGPYSLIGTPIVDSCVRWNTDYVDITGEPTWVRSIIDKFHEAA